MRVIKKFLPISLIGMALHFSGCGTNEKSSQVQNVGFYDEFKVLYMDSNQDLIIRQCDKDSTFPLSNNCQGYDLNYQSSLKDFKDYFGFGGIGSFKASRQGLESARQAYSTSQGQQRVELARIIKNLEKLLSSSSAERSKVRKIIHHLEHDSYFTFGNDDTYDLVLSAFKHPLECELVYQTAFASEEHISCIESEVRRLGRSDLKEAILYGGKHLINEMRYRYAELGLINRSSDNPSNRQTIQGFLQYHKELSDDLYSFFDGFEAAEDDLSISNPKLTKAFEKLLEIIRPIFNSADYRYVVVHPGVKVYSNASCTNLRHGIKAMVYRTLKRNGEMGEIQYNAVKSDHFQFGMTLSWDWDMSGSVSKSWVINPFSGEKEGTWHSSAIFRGRSLKSFAKYK